MVPFLSICTLLSTVYLWWGIRCLPAERWQMAAAVPVARDPDGGWRGVNITWYGILSANAYGAAALLFLALAATLGAPLTLTLATLGATLVICVPASRLVARLVEGKRHTFTVGGAVFVGTIAAPFVVSLMNRLLAPADGRLPAMALLAATACAYALGEGFGRLACVSFGCCYGKPMAEAHPLIGRLLAGRAFVFQGETKKVSYAGEKAGVPLVPIQGITAILYTATALAGSALFLSGRFALSFLVAMGVTQLWRTVSEFVRDDYRGDNCISAYQIMGILAVIYGAATAFYFRGEAPLLPDAGRIAASLWSPAVILPLQFIWLAILFYTGRSTVTGSRIHFHVHRERI
ncbi:MAG: prolipoprotein diacylglyceryl transferase [Desulfuromonadales bacterium]|nr:MAG: prolipoprotein diacylglyceryl transferase [Desulfuromonadales bacterium]